MSSDETAIDDGERDERKRVAFDYIKSQHFRVIRADGAIGGITPSGSIHIAFYSERHPIPRRIVYELTPEEGLGKEIEKERVSRDAIVREMDVDLVVNLSTAISLRDWLNTQIDELEKRLSSGHSKVLEK